MSDLSFVDRPFGCPLDEEWRPMVGWETHYEISSYGRVRRVAPGAATRPGRMLKTFANGLGYFSVQLTRNGVQKTLKITRLVAAAFLSDFNPALHVDHVDGNPSNDHYCNLRVVTRAQNAKNRKLNDNNDLGVKGVSFHKKRRRYTARIQVDGHRLHLGEFKTLSEAQSAYEAAEKRHFGRFARGAENAA